MTATITSDTRLYPASMDETAARSLARELRAIGAYPVEAIEVDYGFTHFWRVWAKLDSGAFEYEISIEDPGVWDIRESKRLHRDPLPGERVSVELMRKLPSGHYERYREDATYFGGRRDLPPDEDGVRWPWVRLDDGRDVQTAWCYLRLIGTPTGLERGSFHNAKNWPTMQTTSIRFVGYDRQYA